MPNSKLRTLEDELQNWRTQANTWNRDMSDRLSDITNSSYEALRDSYSW